MRPILNQYLIETFGSQVILYLIPSGLVIYLSAVTVILWMFFRRCQRSGLSGSHALLAGFLGIVAGMVGARTFYLIQHLDETMRNYELIFRCAAGTASWGAYIGSSLALVIYFRIKKQPLLKYLDVLASVLGLGPFIARWACFLNGCCFGTTTNVPWTVQFPMHSFAYQAHLKAGIISGSDWLSAPVHSVQIYSSVIGLALFFIVSHIWRTYQNTPGVTFISYWLIYGTIRFFIEFLRGDVNRLTQLHLTLSQLIILIIIALGLLMGIGLLVKSRRKLSESCVHAAPD